MAKRGNGEGTIYYSEKLNKWVGQFTAGRKDNGKLNRKSVYGNTRKEVKEKMTKALADVQNNTFIEKNNIKLIDIINQNLEYKFNSNLITERTYRRTLETIKLITNRDINFANKPIQDITKNNIRTFLTKITIYSNSTIDKIYQLLGQAYKFAISNDIVNKNLLDDITIVKPKSIKQDRKVEALTIDEQRMFISIISRDEYNCLYKDIILIMLYSGLRIGEVLALKKEDIDYNQNVIHIMRTLTKDKNNELKIGNTTKTYNSIRDITITPILNTILKDTLEKQVENEKHLLFYNNGLINPVNVNSFLYNISKKYHFKTQMSNHVFRHTYATRCIEAGMSAKVLQKKLGHVDISTTLNTYASVFDKFEKNEDIKLNEYLEKENILINI